MSAWPIDLGDLGPLADDPPLDRAVGPEPARVGATYHAHLDACERCRERPYDLCQVGADALGREVER